MCRKSCVAESAVFVVSSGQWGKEREVHTVSLLLLKFHVQAAWTQKRNTRKERNHFILINL